MYSRDNIVAEFKKAYGPMAEFKPGQLEAIESALTNKRLLVVQKTGWGKSIVYFLTTKLIRRNTGKFTIIISPLLALMKNQTDSAKRLNLDVRTINSENQDEWDDIIKAVKAKQLDGLIISPERLANAEFREMLQKELSQDIGCFVVDEAHCISDWGHDFRPDYRRIIDVINLLPKNVPVIATTATANDRVVEDIKSQLGTDVVVQRGELIRDSIAIQTIHLETTEEKLAWVAKHIDELPGTGVIYCLTIRDCEMVAGWLNQKGIKAEAFYGQLEQTQKDAVIDHFMNNDIKVMVATIAFGMGYDKGDIGFVIHFQKPGNLVSYYQEIGRAGRNIPEAYAILLYGDSEDTINEHFIDSAFPTEGQMNSVIRYVTDNPGAGLYKILYGSNIKKGRLEKCLKYLEVNGDIYKSNRQYFKSAKIWAPDIAKSDRITHMRYDELDRIRDFCRTSGCYMEAVAKELDDVTAHRCGKCSNCLGHKLFDDSVTNTEISEAQDYLNNQCRVINPRKMWPSKECFGHAKIGVDHMVEPGLCLSNYGDAGWGSVVAKDKYEKKSFSPELIDAATNRLKDFVKANDIEYITYVPSLNRPKLVKDMATQLADKLDLELFDGLEKTKATVCQKELNNSYTQWENAHNSFGVLNTRAGNTLLVDDMIDSGWTFTCCGYKLRAAGNGRVYPFALANTSGRDN